jgi:hypothetical protein
MAQIAVKTDCGAAMCMIGHVLDLAGYKMRLKKDFDPASDDSLWGDDDPARSDYEFINPNTGRVVREPLFEAVKLLQMDQQAAEQELFYRYDLKTPKQAADRIRELINQTGAATQ